ncbi:unnamed protein product [Brugia timori]|uniref:Cyclic nucleotide-binding domain-containing protein n=1 Tax=Brugia timori TaxID=42155 RepID=A0A0R3QEG0_9BILA|nr:unnamed protein product [Brugia timori]
MDTEKAVDFFRRKQGFLKKQMEVIEGVLPEKYRARNAIVDNLQKKINVYKYPIESIIFWMRVELLSNCERAFFLNSFKQNVRVDGRKCDEFREVKVIVGSELGSCLVMLGETK